MDIKFYVSLEAARLLKEKGYNKGCNYYFVENENRIIHVSDYVINADFAEWRRKVYTAPTKAEAIDWLESKGMIIEILQDYREKWFYVIKSYVSYNDDDYYSTRLEAEDAAIIKAMELL